MLDSWSTHDYKQNFALDYMKTYLVCDLCLPLQSPKALQ